MENIKSIFNCSGACHTAFPGNFYANSPDQKTICVNSEDKIIRCVDGWPFKIGTEYFKFSDYNQVL